MTTNCPTHSPFKPLISKDAASGKSCVERCRVDMRKFVSLFFVFLVGCSSSPMKDMTKEQIYDVLIALSGGYDVVDSRQNQYNGISHVDLDLRDKGGRAVVVEEGKKRAIRLGRCRLANSAQAKNSGDPLESLDILAVCDIISDFEWAYLSVGRLKGDYVISDQKIINSFKPMKVRSGYFVEIKQSYLPVFLGVIKN